MTNNNQTYFHHLNLKKANKTLNVITLDHAIHIILFQIVYKLPTKKKKCTKSMYSKGILCLLSCFEINDNSFFFSFKMSQRSQNLKFLLTLFTISNNQLNQ